MYAQLCRKLCEEAPNFDHPSNNSNPGNSVPTFRRLLLAKCKDEFENRSKASEDFEKRDGPLSPEEDEQRALAKHKMLGNIKFIGELGKQGLLQEAILHQCIRQLLAKKKRQGLKDTAEDLECLGQIMKTVGRRLDTDKAKHLMDQYFERMKQFALNIELPSRIRFMLQDVLELRQNKWVPRRATSEHGPRTIQQIREEAARDYGMYVSGNSPHHNSHHSSHHQSGLPYGMMVGGGRNMPMPPNSAAALAALNASGKPRGGMDDVFGPLPLGVGILGTGPGVISADGFPSYSSNMGRPNRNNLNNANLSSQLFYGQNRPNHGGGGGQGNNRDRDLYPSYQSPQGQQPQSQQQQRQTSQSSNSNSQHNFSSAASRDVNSSGGRDVPPRFMKRQQNQPEEISLRPAQNSMVLKPKAVASLTGNGTNNGPYKNMASNMSSSSSSNSQSSNNSPLVRDISSSSILAGHNNSNSANLITHPLQKEPPIVIKQVTQDKNKTNKIGPTKEEVLNKTEELLKDLLSKQNQNNGGEEAIKEAVKQMQFPKKFHSEVLKQLMIKTLDKNENDRELVSRLLAVMKKEEILIVNNSFQEALKNVFDKLSEMEVDIPRVKSCAAGFASRAVADELSSLGDVAELLEGGLHYPLFLLCLQQLHKSQGRPWLTQAFNRSKVNLLFMLPEIDRTKDRLADILEDRGLSFLYPLLRIQADLWKQIQSDPSPTSLYKWIKETVDASQQLTPGFIYALVTCMIKYITLETTLADSVDRSTIPDKLLIDKEKDLLEKFKPVFQAFLNEHSDLQLVSLYALQVHCHSNTFPKGMLLRWFMDMYDMEIVEEEAFLKWKEDVNDEYPGKGNALFQVNQWLTWLEEAEEEEGSDEGEN